MKILPLLILLATLPTFAEVTWDLVWSEEFDYTGYPNPDVWRYEVGFIRNNELQYYTESRKKNVRVESGKLILEGHREHFSNQNFSEGSDKWQKSRKQAEYTAGSITTQNKISWQYGRIEIKAKLPVGKGVWPAIWMMGVNKPQARWPHCGEIDIMEFVGKRPQTIHANAHFSMDGKHASCIGEIGIKNPPDQFNIYAIEWFADRIDFFFNDQKYHSFPIDRAGAGDDNPFRQPHFLLLNFAIGGSWGGVVDPDIFPQKYEIDYVRVYRQSPSP